MKDLDFAKWNQNNLIADYARLFADIGALLAGPNGPAIHRLILDTADRGYPTSASGTPSSPHNSVDEDGRPVQPSTATESEALEPDKVALDALALARDLTAAGALAARIAPRLGSFDPARALAHCPSCLEPWEPGRVRCGRRGCESSREAEQVCANRWCDVVLVPGNIRDGRCEACARRRMRNGGVDTPPAKAYGLGENVVVAGVAHAGGAE